MHLQNLRQLLRGFDAQGGKLLHRLLRGRLLDSSGFEIRYESDPIRKNGTLQRNFLPKTLSLQSTNIFFKRKVLRLL